MRPKAGQKKEMPLSAALPPSREVVALLHSLAPPHYGKGDKDGWVASVAGLSCAEKVRKVRSGQRDLTADEYRALMDAWVEHSEQLERRHAAIRENASRLAAILDRHRADRADREAESSVVAANGGSGGSDEDR